MALGKRRGRPPSKKTVKKLDAAKLKRHWLDCVDCEIEGAEVDGDVEEYTCWRCVAKMVPAPPPPKPKLTREQKLERKAERDARKKEREAKKAEREKFGFGRGWHRRILFSSEVDGKHRYFSKGKEVTKAQYQKIEREQVKKAKAKEKASPGFGRGWHFKDKFIAPNGDEYSMGKLVKKAGEPDEAELLALMQQHS